MHVRALKVVAAIAALFGPQASYGGEPTNAVAMGAYFQWPEPNPNALPDARLHELVEKARDEATRAREMAKEADALAMQVREKLEWSRLQPEIVSSGVTLTGRHAPDAGAPGTKVYVGKMRYSYGAELLGSFTFIRYPEDSTWGHGVVTPPDSSQMTNFKGEVAAPADIRSRPSQGVAAFKKGDKFTGLYYLYFGDTDAVGIYEDASGARRFVGQLKTVDQTLQPKQGIVEDANGRLLAVVR